MLVGIVVKNDSVPTIGKYLGALGGLGFGDGLVVSDRITVGRDDRSQPFGPLVGVSAFSRDIAPPKTSPLAIVPSASSARAGTKWKMVPHIRDTNCPQTDGQVLRPAHPFVDNWQSELLF